MTETPLELTLREFMQGDQVFVPIDHMMRLALRRGLLNSEHIFNRPHNACNGALVRHEWKEWLDK